MLRIYFLPQWFNPSHPQAEDAIYDSESGRCFADLRTRCASILSKKNRSPISDRILATCSWHDCCE